MPHVTPIARPLGCLLASTSLLSALMLPATQAVATDAAGSNAVTTSTNRSNAPAAQTKRETVVVTTDATGNMRSIQVTTTLEANGSRDVADTSRLQQLTVSDPKITASTQGALVWHSEDGRDISYTATSNIAPPVKVSVSYSLNGDSISPQDLLGRSGNVTIRYDYLDASRTASGYTPYHPFVAVTAVPLDGDVFSDVSVTNGRLVTENGTLVAYGCGITASQSSSDTQLPTYFEISANVRNFKLEQATSVVSSEPLPLLYLETKSLAGLSGDTIQGLNDKLEELRTRAEEMRSDIDTLANNLSIVANVASQLGYVVSELNNNSNKLSVIDGSSGDIVEQAGAANDAAQSFIDSIYSMDGLSEEQKSQIIASWDAHGVGDSLARMSNDAQTIRTAVGQLDFGTTTQASVDLGGINFTDISQSSFDLRDKLNDMFEKELGIASATAEGTTEGTTEGADDTVLARSQKLKAALGGDDGNDMVLTKTLAAGLSADVLTLIPQVEEEAASKQAGGVTATVTRRPTGNVLAEVATKVDNAIAELAGNETSDTAQKDSYTNYGGILDGTEGSVQFVFNTASIK